MLYFEREWIKLLSRIELILFFLHSNNLIFVNFFDQNFGRLDLKLTPLVILLGFEGHLMTKSDLFALEN